MMLMRYVLLLVVLYCAPDVFGQSADVPKEIESLFMKLDALGRGNVQDARFVELIFDDGSEKAWLVEENDAEAVVLRDDLIPWTFSRRTTTHVPSSWHPRSAALEKIKPADFAQFCKDLAARKEQKEPRMRLHQPEASYRVLVAHAAWKNGIDEYAVPILQGEPGYRRDPGAFAGEALDALAWQHYLRGVNLLMFANRREVLPHLRLAQRIAPGSDHAKAAGELLRLLERMIAEDVQATTPRPAQQDISKLPEERQAEAYIGQLRNLHCVQFSQPGSIMPYATPIGQELSEETPSARLKEMGYAAVPALIKALGDDTPTRTVYHWRDFAHSRRVWRVSDFAWLILRDISGREFGDQTLVGFTYSSMSPEEQRSVRQEVQQWYESIKDLSPDDRMMRHFSSDRFEDWVAAAEHFAEKNDRRPVPLLLDKLKQVGSFQKGEMCEVIAAFGDTSAIEPIRTVLKNADEASDRIRAAIALWKLGDNSGVPLGIEYVTAEARPYGSWDTPVWFLMRCGTDEAMATLKKVVTTGKPEHTSEVIGFIVAALSGNLNDEPREPAGSLKVAEILVAAMDRPDETGMTINDVRVRIKDQAAVALVVMRDGTDDPFGGRFVQVDPSVFDVVEPDASKRDAQIAALLVWYAKNRERLAWDEKNGRLR